MLEKEPTLRAKKLPTYWRLTVKNSPVPSQPLRAILKTASCLALVAGGTNAIAAESYKFRQSPIGAFGGEIAAAADAPGLFGTAILTHIDIYQLTDNDGNDVGVPARNVPLPTGTPTGGAVPNGRYTLNVSAGTIEFSQKQTQLNLVGGYLTESTYADGRIAFVVNVPLIKQSRSYVATQPLGTVSPSAAGTPLVSALPSAQLRGAIAAVAAAVNAQVQAGVAASASQPILQNTEASGFGDTEFSAVWIRHQDRLKVAAGVSLFAPTGSYDKARGPNPGFGNFYTLRPGIAVTYNLNPNHTDAQWDAGVTIAGRLSYGINSTNKDTDYRSGNFVYGELGAVKVVGNWAFGANVLAVQQVTDDSGAGAPTDGRRYRTYGVGPFVSYKLPGKDAGFNLQYSDNFGGRNAIATRALQLRFVKAW
jgi:hypothetical protein